MRGEDVTTNLFAVLGASAAIGRVFDPDEDDPGRRRVVILMDRFWRAKFGGDRAILGRVLTFNGEPYDVIGVMPPGFRALSEHGSGFPIDFFVPAAFDEPAGPGGGRSIGVVGRLKPDVTIERAREELRILSSDLSRRSPETHRDLAAAIAPLHDEIVRRVRPSLLVMLGAVGLVLVIACVNLANLLIVRAIGQEREVAIRMAIGATRAQITIDLAIRGVVLGMIGGAAGLLCGVWTRNLLASLAPVTMPRMDDLALNARVLAVTFVLAAITGIVAGLLPAVQLWRGDAAPTLRASALTTSGVRSVARWRGVLMAAEIAAALTLAVGAGLLVQSLVRLANVDLGYEAHDVLLFTVNPPKTKYRDEAAHVALFEEIERRVASIPGVEAAAVANEFPLRGGGQSRVTILDARGDAARRRARRSRRLPGGEPRLLRDAPHSARARAAARCRGSRRGAGGRGRQRGIRAPLPRRPRSHRPALPGLPARARLTRAHHRRRRPRRAARRPARGSHAAGLPGGGATGHLCRADAPVGGRDALGGGRSAPAAAGDPAGGLVDRSAPADHERADARRGDRGIDGGAPVQHDAARARWRSWPSDSRSSGVYGVVAHAAAERTREIGIRIALGAGRRHVLSLVVASGLRWALVGVVFGLAGAYAGTRFLASLLFGVTPTDLATFAGLAALMLGVAALASYLPAHRAASINPVSALRGD